MGVTRPEHTGTTLTALFEQLATPPNDQFDEVENLPIDEYFITESNDGKWAHGG